MKVHYFNRFIDMRHGGGRFQDIIYVPKRAVMASRLFRPEEIDFFSTDPLVIANAQRMIPGTSQVVKQIIDVGGLKDEISPRYIGEIELPDKIVDEVISAGEEANQADQRFQTIGKKLLMLVSKSAEYSSQRDRIY